MKNPLFKKKSADLLTMRSLFKTYRGWQPSESVEDGWTYSKNEIGTITINESGWVFVDTNGKFVANGDTAKSLNICLQSLNRHPEHGYYRPEKFTKPTIVEEPDVLWKEQNGEKIPDFDKGDKDFLESMGIKGSLRKKVTAAYMNGYAQHANNWIKEHGVNDEHSEKYAETYGLRPGYFKEAIQTLARFASLKQAGRPPYGAFAVPSDSADHVAYVLSKADLTNFDFKNDEELGLTYFEFPTEADVLAAHELVRQTFAKQIESGKGWWASWKQLEPNISEVRSEPPHKSLISSIKDEMKDVRPLTEKEREKFRPDPRQTSLYGEEHSKELQEFYKKKKGTEEYSPFDEIDDPICLCNHTFLSHEQGCEQCGCRGFTPASIEEQVDYLCEHRSFGKVGEKSDNPAVYEREGLTMKVYFDGERIGKVELIHDEHGKEIRSGWDGFLTFTQKFGD